MSSWAPYALAAAGALSLAAVAWSVWAWLIAREVAQLPAAAIAMCEETAAAWSRKLIELAALEEQLEHLATTVERKRAQARAAQQRAEQAAAPSPHEGAADNADPEAYKAALRERFGVW